MSITQSFCISLQIISCFYFLLTSNVWFLLLLSSDRFTNPLHLHQIHHQLQVLAMNRPLPRAWCPPPPRPKATQPCPQPQLCTTPPATVACPPISVNGMCRTELKKIKPHTHHFPALGISTGFFLFGHKNIYFLFYYSPDRVIITSGGKMCMINLRGVFHTVNRNLKK